MFVQEAYRHLKPVAAWGDGIEALAAFGKPDDVPGVVTAPVVDGAFAAALIESLGWHRHWDRADRRVSVSV
jgi:catalase